MKVGHWHYAVAGVGWSVVPDSVSCLGWPWPTTGGQRLSLCCSWRTSDLTCLMPLMGTWGRGLLFAVTAGLLICCARCAHRCSLSQFSGLCIPKTKYSEGQGQHYVLHDLSMSCGLRLHQFIHNICNNCSKLHHQEQYPTLVKILCIKSQRNGILIFSFNLNKIWRSLLERMADGEADVTCGRAAFLMQSV